MSQRVPGVAPISLWGSFSRRGGIWSWLMLLLIPVITILMLLMIAPCIINCLTHFVSAQVNKLQHAVPVQQGYIELHLTMENITHPQMDTAIRTLRPDTSQRGRPNAPHHPSSAGSSQRDLDAPTPKELGLPSLGLLGSQNRKKESKIVVAKRQRKEKASKNRTREGPRTRVRTSGGTKSPPGQPSLHRAGSGGRERLKKEPKLRPSSFELAHPPTSRMYFPLLAR